MIEHKILIVEDDRSFALGLKVFFEEKDFEVIHVVSGEKAIEEYEKRRPSIVLLDVILPGIDGFEVMERILQIDNTIPIIMMTGTEKNDDKRIKGFDMGVVNYLPKPFSPPVLLAQINKLLNPPETKKYNLNGNHITIQHQELKINGSTYILRDKDILVLSALLKKQNETVSRNELLKSVWRSNDYSQSNDLDKSIHRIRTILDNHSGINIESMYGVGYRIC